MSNIKKLMMSAAGGGGLDVDEVFSTYLYDGTGSTQAITNGIDLAGEGGLVWTAGRVSAEGPYTWDTERGININLATPFTSGNSTQSSSLTSFNSNGFSVGSSWSINRSSKQYVSWTFRKAPKFFDVVTFTGTGSASTNIPHNLGVAPGMIIIKRTNATSDWGVWHRGTGVLPSPGVGAGDFTGLSVNANTSSAQQAPNSSQYFTDTYFKPTYVYDDTNTTMNVNGGTYVAYLFAHNDGDGGFGPDGDQDIIKCGVYTGSGGDNNFIDIGFEPQWLLTKRVNSSGTWNLVDNMRGFVSRPFGSGSGTWEYSVRQQANYSLADAPYWQQHVDASGFRLDSANTDSNASGGKYIYVAIRRGSLAPPESATDVFEAVYEHNRGGDPKFDSPFPVDMAIQYYTPGTSWYPRVHSRLMQGLILTTSGYNTQSSTSNAMFDYNDAWFDGTAGGYAFAHMWKRAPGFFDVVAWAGSSSSTANISHNLGVAPQMIWAKNRKDNDGWICYHEALGNTGYIPLNSTSGFLPSSAAWNNTTPTATTFKVGNNLNWSSSFAYVAYLFATVPGVSKVGSYTGNGSSQTIDCGFTSGARFVLVKRTSPSGDWYVWDTERGIVAGNDPHMSLNSTAAEVTSDDSIDPANSGFIVNQVSATNINVSSAPYIFYAIA